MSKCEHCIIKQANALKKLTRPELQSITENKKHIFLKKGESLMTEQMPTTGIYCIKLGKCKLTKVASNGKEQILKFIKKGDLIGHRSMLSGEAVGLNVVAIEDTQACFLPKSAMLDIFRSNIHFSQKLLQNISHQLDDANNRISDIAQKSVKSRLAALILELEELFGVTTDGYVDIKLTREEVANTVGTATESAIRLLSDFKKNELIELKLKQFKILDKKLLKKISDKG